MRLAEHLPDRGKGVSDLRGEGAFNALGLEFRRNLRYHLRKKTPILCGSEDASRFYINKGIA